MPKLCPLTGPRLSAAGFCHGFFGRNGGHSIGDHASLNCSFSVDDDPQLVAANLTKIANYFDLPAEKLATVNQVHSCLVVNVDAETSLPQLRSVQADALVGTSATCALGVRTADCVPVLVGCKATGMASAIHAGWRGVAAGIVTQSIQRMIDLGARTETLVVGIGPHIGASAFEVSPDVAADLDASCPGSKAVDLSLGKRPHVHLGRLITAQLARLGIVADQLDYLGTCTYSSESEYFSYRRDGKRSGRQISIIRPLT
jgi:polyphenol oxidase